jgi:hypothetical protein
MSDISSRREPHLPLSLVLRINEVCNRFELAWQTGPRPRLEDFLGDTPEPERSALLRELIALDIDYRRRAGENPTAEEYHARFPALAPRGVSTGPAGDSEGVEAGLLPVLEGYWEALRRGEQADTAPWLGRHPEGAGGLSDLRLLNAVYDARRMLAEDSRLEVPGGTGSPAAAGRVPASALAPGTLLGEFRIEGWLGGGGMGEVYRAFHTRLKQPVALKVLPAARMADPAALARFEREMEAVGRLNHPHIVRATHAGEAGGVHFLVMELIEGVNLDVLVKRDGPLPVPQTCRLVEQAAEALQHAHDQGLIHRDIKPSNLMLTGNGELKVLDFGLARLRGEGPAAEGATGTNAVLGTADYMAPEQGLDPRTASARSDLYSLGCTLYFLLAGQPPFPGPRYDTWGKKVRAHEHEPVPPIRDRSPDVPAALANLLERLLAKDPADRPTSAGEVAGQLQAIERGLAAESEVPSTGWEVPRRERGAVATGGRRWKGPLRWCLLLGAVVVVGLEVWLVVGQRSGEGPPAQDGPAKLKKFELDCYRVEGAKAVPLGTVSGELGNQPLFTLPFGTYVITQVELTAPAYAFLIAFNANGEAQLRWPVNEQKKPDERVPPPRAERFQDPHPDRVGPTGRPIAFILDDEPRGGLQAFALVLSEKPLPPYAGWKKGRDLGAWRRLVGFSNPFVADTKGTYPVLPGRGLVRGSEGELGRGPDLRPLCQALGEGVEGVEVLAVPVEKRP